MCEEAFNSVTFAVKNRTYYYKALDLVSSGSKDVLKTPQRFIVLMHI